MKLKSPAIRFISKMKAVSTVRKQSEKTPPPLRLGAVKAFASLICAALFGTVLFASTFAVSQPAAGAILGSVPFHHVFIPAGGSFDLNLGSFLRETINTRTIVCRDVSPPSGSQVQSISRNGCIYTITTKSTATSGNEAINFRADGVMGISIRSNAAPRVQINFGPASNLTFTAPTGLAVGTNRTQTINALDYATETHSRYTISCGDATAIDTTELSTVVRTTTGSGCVFTITPKNVQGSASFTVPYTSISGTVNGVIPITVGPPSTITYQAPTSLSVASDLTLAVDASTYASDGSYTIFCGDATNIDTTELNTVVRTTTGNGCTFTVTPKAVQGAASFTVPYRSAGGHTLNGVINLQVGAPSLVFTAPATNPLIQSNSSNTIDLSAYATAGSSAISCGTVTESSALISISSQNGCNVVIAAGSSTGTAMLTVPYMSAAGASLSASLSVDVVPASNITFLRPLVCKWALTEPVKSMLWIM